MCLNTVHTKEHPTQQVKIKQHNQSNIEKLWVELANANLIAKIYTNPTANPNDNFNIICNIVGRAIQTYRIYQIRLQHLININTKYQGG